MFEFEVEYMEDKHVETVVCITFGPSLVEAINRIIDYVGYEESITGLHIIPLDEVISSNSYAGLDKVLDFGE